MKKDMPLEGLRWSSDSGSALYDTPQTAVLGRAGAIFSQCFYTLEILRRMGDIMYWNWAFPLAYFLYNIKRDICHSRLVEYLSISLLFYSYEYLKYLFTELMICINFCGICKIVKTFKQINL